MSRTVVGDAFVFLAKMRKAIGAPAASELGPAATEEVDAASASEIQPLLHSSGQKFLG